MHYNLVDEFATSCGVNTRLSSGWGSAISCGMNCPVWCWHWLYPLDTLIILTSKTYFQPSYNDVSRFHELPSLQRFLEHGPATNSTYSQAARYAWSPTNDYGIPIFLPLTYHMNFANLFPFTACKIFAQKLARARVSCGQEKERKD